jgi:prepilin-type N-terminal cleavage/methylation domain-containing protein
MSLHNTSSTIGRDKKQNGFTIVELVLSLTIIGIITTTFYTFFNTSISQYLSLHRDSLAFGDLATQTQRIGNVLRGLTDITQASDNDLTAYAYFAPNDTYVSLVHYYLTDNNTKMKADVTRMTANPPIGTLIAESTKTFNIIDNFYLPSGIKTFTYYDIANTLLAAPVADQHTIRSIKVSLAVPSKSPVVNSSTSMTITVSLRNRKTNL